MSNSTLPQLPASLDLPAHLSAQKYFFVCTLTVLSWDTLVLSPRSYKLSRTKTWPPLKALYYFLQTWVIADFVVTGVMFFSTSVQQDTDCRRFWPYEPICTAILLFAASTAHVIRVSAIYSHANRVRSIMFGLLFVQAVVTAVCCGFYRSVKLLDGQGCIAGPLNNQSWVAVYWLIPTLLYGASFSFAVSRSLRTLGERPLTPWRLMLRDNLNLYGTIFFVNLINVLFYFIMTPTGPNDPIKTIVTSMAGVLTATMTMRIILGVRGSLENGGTFTTGSGQGSGVSGSMTASAVGVARGRSAPTYTLGDIHTHSKTGAGSRGADKIEGGWDVDKSSVDAPADAKVVLPIVGENDSIREESGPVPPFSPKAGVHITVNKEVQYDE
ncbi:hypothetical protein F5J12DRAFT_713607 [Pisolithus orientalis]|uniref:uncharacterized protein n=1 Tax=Pisolithus orientalis TaxID=936130 RepID=UPI0022258AE9|nr:uncharacterized protein F5J12DRAFT_713607 [Pisolithus orientalis]KAI6030752.1 hypothetical protein F5J12DRAFT_713607 [Pisolithus orientalis]